MKLKLKIVLLIMGMHIAMQAQLSVVEDLKIKLRELDNDSAIVDCYNDLSFELRGIDNAEAYKYARKAADLALKNTYFKGMARAMQNLSSIYRIYGEMDKALDYNDKATLIYRGINDSLGIAGSYNQRGVIYQNYGYDNKALDNFYKAHLIYMVLKDKKGISRTNNNIGVIYYKLNDKEKALKHYLVSLNYDYQLEDWKGVAYSYNNIGVVLFEQDKLGQALDFLFKALDLRKQLNDVKGVAQTSINIGLVYRKQGDYYKAVQYYQDGYVRFLSLNDRQNIVITLINIGAIKIEMNKVEEGIGFLEKSLEFTLKYGYKDELKDIYFNLSSAYLKKKNYQKAFEYQLKYSKMMDSLYKVSGSSNISEILTRFEMEKQKNEMELLHKDAKIKEYESARNKFYQNLLIISLVLIIIFAFIIYLRYSENQKINKKLLISNQEILYQKEEMTLQRNMLENANKNLERINDELKKFSVIAQRTDNAVIIMDGTGKIEWVNEGFEKMYGYSLHEYIRNKGETLVKAISNFEIKNKIQQAITYKRADTYESLVLSKNNDTKWIHTTLTPIIAENGDLQRMVAIETDITRLKKAEAEIKNARETEEANRIKSEFLSNLSHEIRTPLNAILGFSKLLRSELLEEKAVGFVDTIQNSANSLLTLINDIIELSKTETEHIAIMNEPVKIAVLMKELHNLFHLKISEKQLTYVCEINEQLPKQLMLDERRMRQVLFNLIGNAIKFTEKGEVKIVFELQNMRDTKLDLVIHVIDSGIGIPEEFYEIIFEPFRQQYGESARKYGGVGIGLTLTSRMVKALGGTITVKSEKNQGSHFTVILPDVAVAKDEKLMTDDAVFADDMIDEPLLEHDYEIFEKKEQYLSELGLLQPEALAEIVKIIDETLLDEFQFIRKMPKIIQIKQFSTQIKELGEQYKINMLLNYGNRLLKEAENFSISKMNKLLDYFPGLVNVIRSLV